MNTSPILDKANNLKPAEDYNFLRREGIKKIEKLAGDVWTDYNTHDPGITLIEALCYAITDLAYRTNFEIKDLLTPEVLESDSWKNIFYTAKQILPCNPVTIIDYRKLLIDIPGVRNAWIYLSKDYEVPLYIDYDEIKANFQNVLDYQEANNLYPCCCDGQIKLRGTYLQGGNESQLEGLNFSKGKIIELNGLYKIIIEYEEDVIEEHKRSSILEKVEKKLHSHRNVCEDFLDISEVEYKDFYLNTEVILKNEADADEVLAEMCFRIQRYFTPNAKFYTLEQLVADVKDGGKGMQVDEIFEGPLLKHGFILDEELEKTDLFRDMRLSDIINDVADIENIIALRVFKILDVDIEEADEKDACANEKYFDEWIELMQKEKLVGRLSIDSLINFFIEQEDNYDADGNINAQNPFLSNLKMIKSGKEIKINPDRFQKLLRDKKALDRKAKLIGHASDYPVPIGEYKNIGDFYPIQYELPFTYRVGEAGLPMRDGNTRLVQSLQLKGYLAVFEQIFLDYISQLGSLNEIFSFGDVRYKGKMKTEVDPCQEIIAEEAPPDEIKGQAEKIMEIVYKDDDGNWQEKIIGYLKLFIDAENYYNNLVQALEPQAVFEYRRNGMLDHLLARFAEEMNEYSALMKYLYPKNYLSRIIKSKSDFLSDYIVISRDRMKAYNYKLEEECLDFEGSKDEDKIAHNISGLEKRVARLLGFKDYLRKDLAPENLVIKKIDEETIRIILYDDDLETILLETKKIKTKCEDEVIHCFIESGCCGDNFISLPEKDHPERRHHHSRERDYSFRLLDEDGKVIAHSTDYRKKEERDKALQRAKCVLEKICRVEGMHMIEHILLRPKGDEQYRQPDGSGEKDYGDQYRLLDICLDKCDLNIGVGEGQDVDYRFDTLVLPPEECLDGKRWKVTLKRITDNKIIFEKTFEEYEEASEFISLLREYGSEFEYYQVFKEEGSADKFFFDLIDENGKIIAESVACYNAFGINPVTKKKTAPIGEKENPCTETPLDFKIWDEIKGWKDTSGKIFKGLKDFLAFELDLYGCENPCDNNEDPYSFRVSFVLPCWPKRFRDQTFRDFVERTIQSEIPAHVHARIFWLSIEDMRDFEDTYFNWIIEMACNDVPKIKIANELIKEVNKLKNCDDKCKEDKEPD